MSPARQIKPLHWETVRGHEDRDNTARLVEGGTRSPWDVEHWNLDPSKISIYDSGQNHRTGKPRDALSGANGSVNFAQDLSNGNIWFRVGTVFFGVLSIGLVLILISRAMSLSAATLP